MRYKERISFDTEIVNILNHIKCTTYEQLLYFFPDEPEYMKEKVLSTLKYLGGTKVIFSDENTNLEKDYITLRKNPNYDAEYMDCVWTLFATIEASKDPEQRMLANHLFLEAKNPFKISAILDRAKICNFVYVRDPDDSVTILGAREQAYASKAVQIGKEDKSRMVIYFVSRDINVLDEISDLDIPIPHKIAILSGEKKERPTIQFFEKQM